MAIQVSYQGVDSKKIKRVLTNIYRSLGANSIGKGLVVIYVHKSRKILNKRLGRKTKEWEVANASYDGEIDILHPDAMARESSHDRNEFAPILKHELAHLIVDKLSGENVVPKWLDEGFSSYVSGQYKTARLRGNYIKENFCKELGTPKGWNKNLDFSAYSISSLFVAFLVDEYSLTKIKNLISSMKKNYSYPEFKKSFKNIFQEDIEKLERRFIKKIKNTPKI